MPNRYRYTDLEKAINIIEWDGGTDFKGQLEYMAKNCGWDVIATYATHKAAQQSGQGDVCNACGSPIISHQITQPAICSNRECVTRR